MAEKRRAIVAISAAAVIVAVIFAGVWMAVARLG
jgi:hypothetical protein